MTLFVPLFPSARFPVWVTVWVKQKTRVKYPDEYRFSTLAALLRHPDPLAPRNKTFSCLFYHEACKDANLFVFVSSVEDKFSICVAIIKEHSLLNGQF